MSTNLGSAPEELLIGDGRPLSSNSNRARSSVRREPRSALARSSRSCGTIATLRTAGASKVDALDAASSAARGLVRVCCRHSVVIGGPPRLGEAQIQ